MCHRGNVAAASVAPALEHGNGLLIVAATNAPVLESWGGARAMDGQGAHAAQRERE